MFKKLTLILLFCAVATSTNAAILMINDSLLITSNYSINTHQKEIKTEDTLIKEVKFKRGKAIVLTILTGFLGGHRIYLGTHQRTPIIYAVTFGGFGILPLIDLIHLVFTKDISVFENKTQIMMWRKD